MKSKKIIFALSIVIGLVVVLVYSLGKKEKIKRNDTYTQYVDPLIGSGGHGHVFVGANVPFGFVQLGPTQLDGGWDWCSGYNYSSNVIAGFTHTHLSGTGCADLNDILLLPFTGKTNLTQASYHDLKNPESATKEELENSYGSLFTHKNEVVKPGYY
ncbi:MAG TPA: glycoside hydrolase family 92 protein, partial [Flavobacterium sp.]|nr:glycoside hydrolase family 92 protein [Flavobacterium sp.]